MGGYSFPKHFHLLRTTEFRQVYRRGGRRQTKGFIIYRLGTELRHPRLGLSVGRRYGKAVPRNRIRRLLREAVRLNWRSWGLMGSDLVIIPKGTAGQYRLEQVTEELSKCLIPWRKK